MHSFLLYYFIIFPSWIGLIIIVFIPADVYVLPEGKARTIPVDEFDPYVIKYSDSDTEMEDSGPNKRSRRRDVSRGKKRRF